MDVNAKMIGPRQRGERQPATRVRPGFSLIDLLVSMSVMGVLIGVLMPAVAHVRDMARRTECRSNIRQQGLALQMYAYDHEGRLPQSVFSSERDVGFAYAPEETVHLRVGGANAKYHGEPHSPNWAVWDGMGLLYGQEYLTSPQIFYCPGNRGLLDYPEFAKKFEGEPGDIVGNYQYRLIPSREYLSDLNPEFTMISNATRSAPEYSHRVGNNMLKADMSVSWFTDTAGRLLASISNPSFSGRGDLSSVSFAWKLMDTDGMYMDHASERNGARTGEDDESMSVQNNRDRWQSGR